jgi:hypothetical protein
MWLLKPRAERLLKRNLRRALSRLSWQLPYRGNRSYVVVQRPRLNCIERTLCVVTSTASRPSTHSTVQTRATAWKHFIVYRREPNIQEKTLKKWFTFKNVENMRLVSVEMNRIGYCSSFSIGQFPLLPTSRRTTIVSLAL